MKSAGTGPAALGALKKNFPLAGRCWAAETPVKIKLARMNEISNQPFNWCLGSCYG